MDKRKYLLPNIEKCKVAILGLGYVGLPLAVEIAKNRFQSDSKINNDINVIGYDLDPNRIDELKSYFDRSGELSKKELEEAKIINFTNDKNYLNQVDIFIVTVPTPIDSANKPDLRALKNATRIIGEALLKRKEVFAHNRL